MERRCSQKNSKLLSVLVFGFIVLFTNYASSGEKYQWLTNEVTGTRELSWETLFSVCGQDPSPFCRLQLIKRCGHPSAGGHTSCARKNSSAIYQRSKIHDTCMFKACSYSLDFKGGWTPETYRCWERPNTKCD